MLGLLAGVAWLPVCLAAAEFAARARPARRPARRAAARRRAGGSILAGSQQLAAVAALSAGLWLWMRAGRRGVLLALAGVLAAVLLSAVALLPRLELLGRSSSAEGVADPSGIGSLVRDDLRAVFGRYGVSRSELTTLYAGAATPALALFGLAVLRRRALPLRGARRLRGRVGVRPRRLAARARCRCSRASQRTSRCARWPSPCWPERCSPDSPCRACDCGDARSLLLGPEHRVLDARARRCGRAQGVVPAPARSRSSRACRRSQGRAQRSRSRRSPCCSPMTLDLAWHADHQDREIVWRSASSVFPKPAPSARFLLARQATREPVQVRHGRRSAGAAPPARRCGHGRARGRCCSTPSRCGSGSRTSRATTRCISRRYNRYLLASNGGTGGRPPLRVRRARADRQAARARGALLRLTAGPAAEGPARSSIATGARSSRAIPTRCRSRASCARAARAAAGAHRPARARPRRHRDGRRGGNARAGRLRPTPAGTSRSTVMRPTRDGGLALPRGRASGPGCTVSCGRSGRSRCASASGSSIAHAVALLAAPRSAGRGVLRGGCGAARRVALVTSRLSRSCPNLPIARSRARRASRSSTSGRSTRISRRRRSIGCPAEPVRA